MEKANRKPKVFFLMLFSVPLCLGVLCDLARAQAESPPRVLTELTTGQLYLPPHLKPRDGKIDLVIHFHGGDRVLPDAADALRLNAAVVPVHFGGLSSAYRKPFEDRERFGRLLSEAREQLRSHDAFGPDAELGRVVLVSFSAGYGAVREILKTPAYVERIDGVLLTDSMYASYAGDPAERKVEQAHVASFVSFAKLAAAGEKTFVVTHTYLEPGSYAGTHETAAHLIAELGLHAEPVPDAEATRDATGDLRLIARTQVAGLHVLGYAGDTGQDHGDHLRRTAGWLPLLPLEFLPAE